MIALAPYTLWLDEAPRPGWRQMAIDETLLERAAGGQRWLRLYRWEPCLSFGRHEPVARRYDRARIDALGLATVRRPTGGRAVWHARELTYALVAPGAAAGDLTSAYRAIHEVLRAALALLGAAATLAPRGAATPVDAGACFASPAGGEILLAGGKVVGSAQRRERGALLQHGSVLLDDDQAVVTAVTIGAAPVDRSLPLARALGRPVTWSEVARAVVAAAASRWGTPMTSVTEAASVVAASEAHVDRYRSPEWTWEASAGSLVYG
jgi:lipoyl(octanoyl) transferase